MPVHPVDLFAQGDLGSKLHSGARVDPEQVALTCALASHLQKGLLLLWCSLDRTTQLWIDSVKPSAWKTLGSQGYASYGDPRRVHVMVHLVNLMGFRITMETILLACL